MSTPPFTPADPALAPAVLDRLALDVQQLRQELLVGEEQLAEAIAAVHPQNRPSARNLAHYLALRRHDIRGLQLRLARVGLSSLGRSEPHVLITLDRILGLLALARGTPVPLLPPPPVSFRQGERILASNTRLLFGERRAQRIVRIIVTLPTEAADDPRLVHDLVGAGMDCARINCARDDAFIWARMAENVRAAERAHDRECRILVDLGGPKLRTGEVAGGAKRLLLAIGDRFELVAEAAEELRRQSALPRIACTAPEVLQQVQPGQSIWFDDGEIGGTVEERTDRGLLIQVTHARPEGSKLRPQRGINLPQTSLDRPALTDRDLRDLSTVVGFADAIELSFVQTREDVQSLHDALAGHGADHVGVILKIETRRAFADLPQLLLTAMQRRSCGVMIARGDLAVEAGFERMVEMQEEILWVAEAAHVPTIWATQVLEQLAKKGTLSRSEVTDAAVSARAEAVMLSKGPFVVDAIGTLDRILSRMQEHQVKKRALFRSLGISRRLWH